MKKHITAKLKPRQCTDTLNGYYPRIYYADGATAKPLPATSLYRARQRTIRRSGQKCFSFYRWARYPQRRQHNEDPS